MALPSKYTLAILTSSFLIGCGSVPKITSTPIPNVTEIPIKNVELTENQLQKWGALDLIRDTVPGMSVDRTYSELIKNRKGQKVIVGVIDSGVDIEHEDLDDVLWTNTKEIKGNGIDDDNNGYIDDIHGWNFLGDAEEENLEFVRIVKKLKSKYEGKTTATVSDEDRDEYLFYLQAKTEFEEKYQENAGQNFQYQQILGQSEVSHKAIVDVLKKEEYTKDEVLAIEATTGEMQQHVAFISQMFGFLEPGDKIPDFIKTLQEGVEHFTEELSYNLNLDFDGRKVVGDDVDDISDTKYGDNNVMGPDPKKKGVKHGTHVAGIIAAERNNNIGMNGVADNVEIMSIRAVPNGDEYDKDIALAIRYAVDNGAKVINTSFGKYYSTHPEWVREAIIYAGSKDVLIVNAAGNESKDLDATNAFPNDQFDNGSEISDNFITIGALNFQYGSNLVAEFSNYGKINVDAFAPGVEIWATVPNNEYEYLMGTSMAAPAVAGAAAVLRSYYPSLKANEVKKILMDSGLSPQTIVNVGEGQLSLKKFPEVSKSGKMVNLYNAFIMADKMAKL